MTELRVGQYAKLRTSVVTTVMARVESIDRDVGTAVVAHCDGSGCAAAPLADLAPAMLVVVDLNGVLGYRKQSKRWQPRPHVAALLDYLFKHFMVGVWTSCIEENGRGIIQSTFGEELQARLLFSLFRDACTPHPTRDNRYGTMKDLRRVWALPQLGGCFGPADTIHIDDSPEKVSHPQNALCPTPFVGTQDGACIDDDAGLPELIEQLRKVVAAKSLAPLRGFVCSAGPAVSTRGQLTPKKDGGVLARPRDDRRCAVPADHARRDRSPPRRQHRDHAVLPTPPRGHHAVLPTPPRGHHVHVVLPTPPREHQRRGHHHRSDDPQRSDERHAEHRRSDDRRRRSDDRHGDEGERRSSSRRRRSPERDDGERHRRKPRHEERPDRADGRRSERSSSGSHRRK
jgi:hypothetical protein